MTERLRGPSSGTWAFRRAAMSVSPGMADEPPLDTSGVQASWSEAEGSARAVADARPSTSAADAKGARRRAGIGSPGGPEPSASSRLGEDAFLGPMAPG